MPSDNNLLSDSALLALRFVTGVIIFSVLFLTIRRGILIFVGRRGRHLSRKKYVVMAGNALAVAFLFFCVSGNQSAGVKHRNSCTKLLAHSVAAMSQELLTSPLQAEPA
jgi:hypothetical protein